MTAHCATCYTRLGQKCDCNNGRNCQCPTGPCARLPLVRIVQTGERGSRGRGPTTTRKGDQHTTPPLQPQQRAHRLIVTATDDATLDAIANIIARIPGASVTVDQAGGKSQC